MIGTKLNGSSFGISRLDTITSWLQVTVELLDYLAALVERFALVSFKTSAAD